MSGLNWFWGGQDTAPLTTETITSIIDARWDADWSVVDGVGGVVWSKTGYDELECEWGSPTFGCRVFATPTAA